MANDLTRIPPNVPPIDPKTGLFTYIWYMYFNNLQTTVSSPSGTTLSDLELIVSSQPQLSAEIDSIARQVGEVFSLISSIDQSGLLNLDQKLNEIYSRIENVIDLTPIIRILRED